MSDVEKIPSDEMRPLSVAEFLEQINYLLSNKQGRVRGEVTSISNKYESAIYFTIKDNIKDALLDCIIWRFEYTKNGLDIKVGDEIIVTGAPEVYLPRGKFSLKIKTIEYAGEGALKRSYDELRDKLTMEGLFAVDRKRELPKYPEKIGIITSKVGVVMQDFISNLGRYGFKIKMIDSRVEGKDSIHEILSSIKRFEKEDLDLLVIMRGGGSWESLQPFNTESVVRAIANFKYPVLTGIGHDVDVTLAQMVADVGVSTPTAAAETLNESWEILLNSIRSIETKTIERFRHELSGVSGSMTQDLTKIFRSYERFFASQRELLSNSSSKVSSFFSSLEKQISSARGAFQKSVGIMRSNVFAKRQLLAKIPHKLVKYSQNLLSGSKRELANYRQAVLLRPAKLLVSASTNLKSLERNISLLNPENNLRLGYSLAYFDGKLVRSVKNIDLGGIIETYLTDGKIMSKVSEIK